jgi:hypothetical protein
MDPSKGRKAKGAHRWNGPGEKAGEENECLRCGLVRRWKNSRAVIYLRPDVTGWTVERPSCREVEDGVERLASDPRQSASST